MVPRIVLLAALIGGGLTAGCKLTDDSNSNGGDGETVAYSVPVLAPDACYVADEAQEVSSKDGVTYAKRILRREDGICAQSMTEVVFRGEVLPEAGSKKVVLQIVSPKGEVLNSFSLR